MVGIGAQPDTTEFGENRRTTRARVLLTLEHKNTSTLAQNKPIALTVEWSRRRLGSLVVTRRQCTKPCETGHS